MVVATTSDVTVGDNRIGFSLFDFEGESIVVDQVLVEAIFYPPNENEGVIKDTSTAYWMSIPGVAGKGLYVTDIFFDVSGAGTQENPNYWEIVGSFVYEDESTWSKAAIVVNEYSSIIFLSKKKDKEPIKQSPAPDVSLTVTSCWGTGINDGSLSSLSNNKHPREPKVINTIPQPF